MNETLQLLSAGATPAEWCGKQVKVKGLIGGSHEVLMVGELVGVSELGAVLSWRGCRSTCRGRGG